MTWGVIDDEAIAEARSMIGVELRRERFNWVKAATQDTINHFAWGIGDDNPLWLDEDYAKKTQWGSIIAPPIFLYAVDGTTIAPKLPGVQWIYAGTEWSFYEAVKVNDSFTAKAKLIDQKEKSGGFADRWVLQIGEVLYYNQHKRLVAKAISKCARLPRGEQLRKEGKGKYKPRDRYKYSTEEIATIERDILSERRRGSTPRYFEEVEVGEELTPVVKGPLNSTDMVGWYSATQGAMPYGGTHEMVFHYRRRHEDYHIDPETGTKDSAGRGHLEAYMGEEVGMGGAYDVGMQRISWLSNLITNWMGDDGFLVRLTADLRLPNLLGDTTWCKGKVINKYVDSDTCFVECEVWGENQFKKVNMPGRAVIALPSKTRKQVPLPLNTNLKCFA